MLSTKKIADSAISLGEVAHTAIVISGDLAFSGNETEYIYVNRCVKHILEHYKAKSHNQSFIPIFFSTGFSRKQGQREANALRRPLTFILGNTSESHSS